jgi:hypothetical protein
LHPILRKIIYQMRHAANMASSTYPATAANTIEIRIEKIAQLFHSLDPFPYREKDLDNDVENSSSEANRNIPYDWSPIVRRPNLYQRLSAAHVKLRSYQTGDQKQRAIPGKKPPG